MRPFSLLVLLMAIALVLGEKNSAKKQDENEDEGDGELLPKQERGKSNALTYLILKRKAVMTYTNQNTAGRKKLGRATFAKNILIKKKCRINMFP